MAHLSPWDKRFTTSTTRTTSRAQVTASPRPSMMVRAPCEKMSPQSNRHSVGTVLIKEAVQIWTTGTSCLWP